MTNDETDTRCPSWYVLGEFRVQCSKPVSHVSNPDYRHEHYDSANNKHGWREHKFSWKYGGEGVFGQLTQEEDVMAGDNTK